MSNNSLNYLSAAGVALKKADLINSDQFENYPADDPPGTFDGPASEGGCGSGFICVQGLCVPIGPPEGRRDSR
jgi:hypothetical protein